MNLPDLSNFTDTNLLSLVTGFLLPPLIAIVQQPKWANWLRALVTALACILFGCLQAYIEHKLNQGSILHNILVILIASNSFYRGFWKPIGMKTVEEATKLPDLSAIVEEKTKRDAEDKLIAEQKELDRQQTLERARKRLADQASERDAATVSTGDPSP